MLPVCLYHNRIEHKAQKDIESLEIQKEQQRKLTQKAEENTFKEKEQVQEGKRTVSSLEVRRSCRCEACADLISSFKPLQQSDIHSLRLEIGELKKTVSRLERERSNLHGELVEQQREYQHVVEEVKGRDMKVSLKQTKCRKGSSDKYKMTLAYGLNFNRYMSFKGNLVKLRPSINIRFVRYSAE